MAYTTKFKYYRTEKLAYYFSRPIMSDFKLSPEIVQKRVLSRKESAETKDENKDRSVARARIQIFDLAIMNDWEWFVTFTFDPKKVDSYDYPATSKKMSQWLKNMKKDNPDMKYLIVPEKHLSGRFHFHALMTSLNPQIFDLSGLKDKKGRDIYNLGKYRLGWSTATKIGHNERAVKYLTKYVTKDTLQVSKNKKKYWCSSDLTTPTVDKLDLTKTQQKHMIEHDENQSTPPKTILIENGEYQNSLTIYKVKL